MVKSIRWRIALPYIALVLVAALGLGLYLSDFMRDAYLRDIEGQLLSEARLVADALAPVLDQGESGTTLDESAKRYSALTGSRITVVASDGVVIGESHENRAGMDNHLYRVEIQDALRSGSGASIRYSLTLGYELLYVAAPVRSGDQVLGVVRLALPLRQIQFHVSGLRLAVIVAALVTAFGAAALAMWIADRITRPVRQLTEVMRRMETGDLSARVLPTTGDEVGALCLAFNNMAARQRQAMDELSREKSRLETILQNTINGILITDGEGRVRLINPAAERLLAADARTALGQTFAQVARNHRIIAVWERCFEQRLQQAGPVEVDARSLYLQVVVVPLPGKEEGACLVILQDLSQTRRLQTARRDLVANVSHELRTPLASLKALTETLRDGALDDPPAATRFLDQLNGQVDDLTQIVDELVELTRIESGQVPLRLAPVMVADVVNAVLQRLAPQAERAGLVIASRIPADLPAILADRDRIGQVTTNLLHNAIKFTPRGGRVEVEAAVQASEVVVSVHDTGIGISAESLPRVFERFYKVDRSRTEGGTGLGLAIAKHIVQAHGGRIWVESREGEGSTFSFAVPRADGGD